jgi:hypothetical protein
MLLMQFDNGLQLYQHHQHHLILVHLVGDVLLHHHHRHLFQVFQVDL